MRTLIILLFIFCSAVTFAQPTIPDDPPSAEPVPISGIEILLIAGAALGIKKLRRTIKEQN